MRKAVMILIALICVGAAVNRNAFKSDISNRAVVQGVGIDINDDGTYTVTLEIINTENYSTGERSAKPIMNLRTLKGTTVSSAIKSAYSIDGKTPVLSQNRVIVIGKGLAQKGIMPSLDFFIRDAENYPTVQIVTVEKKAADFFKEASSEATVVSRNIEKILLTADEDTAVSSITLCELVNDYKSADNSFYMPIIKTFKEKDSTQVSSNGTAIFKDGKFVCSLSEKETSSLNYLCNNARKGTINFLFDGESASISIINSKIKRTVDYSSGKPHFIIKIKLDADIAEIDSDSAYNPSKEKVIEIANTAAENLKFDIEQFCKKLYFEEKTDAPGLSRLIYIYYPEKFKKYEKNLSEIMTESQYTAEVEIKIRRIGQDYSS